MCFAFHFGGSSREERRRKEKKEGKTLFFFPSLYPTPCTFGDTIRSVAAMYRGSYSAFKRRDTVMEHFTFPIEKPKQAK